MRNTLKHPRVPISRLLGLFLSALLWIGPAAGAETHESSLEPTAESAPTALPLPASPTLDERLFRAINLRPEHRDGLDPLFLALMPLGDRTAGGISAGLYFAGKLGDDAQLRDAGLLTAAALVSNALVTEGVKGLVSRRRPVEALGDARVRVVGERMADSRSFPSGHTSTAFAWATVLSGLYPRGTLFFYGTATAVGVGRVRLGAHYPSDVLAGAVLGFATGRFVLANRDLMVRRETFSQGIVVPQGFRGTHIAHQFRL